MCTPEGFGSVVSFWACFVWFWYQSVILASYSGRDRTELVFCKVSVKPWGSDTRFWSRGHQGPTLPKALHDLGDGDTQPASERGGARGQRRARPLWRSWWAAARPSAGFGFGPSCWWLTAGPAPLGRGLQPPLPPPPPPPISTCQALCSWQQG